MLLRRFEELSRRIKYLTLKSVDRGPGQSSQNVKVRLIIGRMLKVGFYINVALICVGGRLAGLDTNSIFLCFFFCKNSLICLEGKSMTPRRGNTLLCSSKNSPISVFDA